MMEKSKNETILWDLRELEDNNKCADCTDSFPRFLNTSFGTFVCSVCGAVHRELGHRVKSLASDKFNDEEIEKLKNIGNKKAQDIWLRKWSEKEFPTPLPSDEKKVREFIKLKYIEKKWAALDQLASLKSPPAKSSLSSSTSSTNNSVPPSPASITSPYERKSNPDSRKSISKEFEQMSLSSSAVENGSHTHQNGSVLSNSTATTSSIAAMYDNGNASKYAPLPPRNSGNNNTADSANKPFNPFREENKYFTEKKDNFPPFSKEPFDQHTYLKEKSTFYQKITLDTPKTRTPPTHAMTVSNYHQQQQQEQQAVNKINQQYSQPQQPMLNSSQGNMMQQQQQQQQPLMITGPNFNPFVDQSINQQPVLNSSQGNMMQQPQMLNNSQSGMMMQNGVNSNMYNNQTPSQTNLLPLPAPQQQQNLPQQSGLFSDLVPAGYQPQPIPLALPPQFQQHLAPQYQQPYQQTQQTQQYMQPPQQQDPALDELFGLKSQVNPEPVFPGSDLSFENGNQLDFDEDQNRAWRDIEDKKRQYLKDHEYALKLQKEINQRPQTPPIGSQQPATRQRSKTEPPLPLRSSSSGSSNRDMNRSGQYNTSSGNNYQQPQQQPQRNRSRSSSMESSTTGFHKNTTTHPLHSSNYQNDRYDYSGHEIVNIARNQREQRQRNDSQLQLEYHDNRDNGGFQSPRQSTNEMVIYQQGQSQNSLECDLCGSHTSFDQMAHHKNAECLFRQAKCNYCQKLIKFIQLSDHQEICQSKLFTCGVCGRSIPGRDMPYHLSAFHNR